MTLKIFVFDEITIGEVIKEKQPVTFTEQVFSVFRRQVVFSKLWARPPTQISGALKSVLRNRSAFNALCSLTINGNING